MREPREFLRFQRMLEGQIGITITLPDGVMVGALASRATLATVLARFDDPADRLETPERVLDAAMKRDPHA